MKKISVIVVLLFVFSLYGVKLDRSSQVGLLKSWLIAVCQNDNSAAWNALSENTRDAIKKEYTGSLADIKSQWLFDVRKSIGKFALIADIGDLPSDNERMAKVLAAYQKKITFIQDGGEWQLSSPEVEGDFFKGSAAPDAEKKTVVQRKKKENAAPVSQKKTSFAGKKNNPTSAAKSEKSEKTADNERVTLALKVIRSIIKLDSDGLWQFIAPSNRADIMKKCGSEDEAKKNTLKLLAIAISMKGAPADIEKNLTSQMKMARIFAKNEKGFVKENGKLYIIAFTVPGNRNRN